MSKTTPELPIVECTTSGELEEWLEAHHEDEPGVWVKIGKIGSDSDTLTFEDALRATLCFGWFAGIRRNVDTEHFLQKFSTEPLDREWSWIECDTAEWLIEQDRMRPAGLEFVTAAKADERWERAYASRGELPVPNLLKARLASYPEARKLFESLPDRDRNAIVYRMQGIVDRETYMRRVDQIVESLLAGETPY